MGFEPDPKDVIIKYLERRIDKLQTIIENLKSWVYQRIDEDIPDDILKGTTMVFHNFTKECTVSLQRLPQHMTDYYSNSSHLGNVHDPEIKIKQSSSSKAKFNKEAGQDNEPDEDDPDFSIRQQDPTKPFKCTYPNCIKEYKYKSSFVVHISQEHERKNKFDCLHCQKVFFHRKVLNKHMRGVHKTNSSVSVGVNENEREKTIGENINITQDFSCLSCNKPFQSSYALKTHNIAEHQRSQEYPCKYDNCGKVFYNHRYLDFHISRAHDGKNIERKNIKNQGKIPINAGAGEAKNNTYSIDINYDADANIKQEQKELYEVFYDESVTEDINFSEPQSQPDGAAEQLISDSDDQEFEPVMDLEEGSDSDEFDEFFNQNQQPVNPLACKFCNKIFATKRSKKTHEINHEQTQEYICDYTGCGKVFYHTRNLYWHKRGAHNIMKSLEIEKGDTPTTTMPSASVEKEDNPDFSIHQQDPTKPFKCTYPNCIKEYRYRSSFLVHISQEHERKNRFDCLHCKKVFFHRKAFNKHMRGVHKTSSSVSVGNNKRDQEKADNRKRNSKIQNKAKIISEAKVCYICGKSYKKSKYLRDHMKDCHLTLNDDGTLSKPNPKPRKYRNCFKEARICPICGQVIKLSSTYFTHMRNHKNERKYKCDICPRDFNNNTALNYHRVTHFPPEIQCDNPDCTKKFYRIENKRIHMKTVHSNEFNFECKVCGNQYKIMRHLTIHQNKSGH